MQREVRQLGVVLPRKGHYQSAAVTRCQRVPQGPLACDGAIPDSAYRVSPSRVRRTLSECEHECGCRSDRVDRRRRLPQRDTAGRRGRPGVLLGDSVLLPVPVGEYQLRDAHRLRASVRLLSEQLVFAIGDDGRRRKYHPLHRRSMYGRSGRGHADACLRSNRPPRPLRVPVDHGRHDLHRRLRRGLRHLPGRRIPLG